MIRWAVIGASSFTGSWFARYLVQQGFQVQRISFRDDPPVKFIADYVVNFAALNVVAPSWEHPTHYMRVNVQKQIRLWDMLKDMQILRYIHISTPEVYGSTNGIITEDAPYNPSTPYAVSRACAEMMLKAYGMQYSIPYVITRGCNVYGPGQQLYRLIPKLICHIKHGKRFPLEGGGNSVRAFLHVRDVCDAIFRVSTQGHNGHAYHISTKVYPIKDTVRMVCDLMGVNPDDVIEQRPDRPGKDSAYILDSSRIRLSGWQPQVHIWDGIREVIAWVDANWSTLKSDSMEYEFKP